MPSMRGRPAGAQPALLRRRPLRALRAVRPPPGDLPWITSSIISPTICHGSPSCIRPKFPPLPPCCATSEARQLLETPRPVRTTEGLYPRAGGRRAGARIRSDGARAGGTGTRASRRARTAAQPCSSRTLRASSSARRARRRAARRCSWCGCATSRGSGCATPSTRAPRSSSSTSFRRAPSTPFWIHVLLNHLQEY